MYLIPFHNIVGVDEKTIWLYRRMLKLPTIPLYGANGGKPYVFEDFLLSVELNDAFL